MFFSPACSTPRSCFYRKVCPCNRERYQLPPSLSFSFSFPDTPYFFNLVSYNSLKLCLFLHRNCRINFLSLWLDSVFTHTTKFWLHTLPAETFRQNCCQKHRQAVIKIAYVSFNISNLVCELCIFWRAFKAVSCIQPAEGLVVFSPVKHLLTFQPAVFWSAPCEGATSRPLLPTQEQLPSRPSPKHFHTPSLCHGGLFRFFCRAGSGEEQFAGKWWIVWQGSCSALQVLDPLAHTKPSHWLPLNAVLQHLSFSSVW